MALAHEEGIAHRDIKPGNLMMVTSRRGDTKMKLLDFGIAKVMTDDDRAPSPGQTSTQPHLQMFSLEYAAPEQLSGTRTGPWTDVHALSLVLTEMLTGEQPYEGDDSVEIFSEALSRRRPTPDRWGLDVGPWEPVLQRALALRPADRYPDAGSLLKALLAEVPQQAVWREDRSVPPAPSSDRPAPAPVPAPAPEVEPATRDSDRITELLPQPPRQAPERTSDDDPEPVRLPINRMGWLGWAAGLLGIVGVVVAVFATRQPAPSRPPTTPPVAARPVAPPAIEAAPALVPAAAPAPAPEVPAAVVPDVPTVAAPPAAPAVAPVVLAAPPPAAPTAPRVTPTRAPVRRARPAGESGGRIPIE